MSHLACPLIFTLPRRRALTTGQVDDSDRCCQCGSLAIVAYDANGAPRCEAHKPEGAW